MILDGGEQGVEFLVVNVQRIAVVDAGDEVTEDVHVVGEGIVGRIIDSAITTVAVGLGAHEAEVVGSLEIVKVLHETAVAADANTVSDGVEFVDGFTLHDVSEPGGEVSFFVHPGSGVGDGEFACGLHLAADFGWCAEDDSAFFELCGESLHELEDVGRERLEDAERAEFHEDVDHLFFFGKVPNPVGVGVSEERIFAPGGVVEAEGDVLRE